MERIINEFEDRVLKNLDKLEKGMIHGDFNEQNILVERRGEEWRMISILDFGDTQYSCYVFELATLMTYIMILVRSVNAGGYVLRGYSRIRKISDEELNLLKVSLQIKIFLIIYIVIRFSSILQYRMLGVNDFVFQSLECFSSSVFALVTNTIALDLAV